ncbi:MAG: Gfo/Idh/MocA family oxidoreductase [Planctomycetota bacterium]|jgi:predicted dehydrogenase|nr:Gfo/Idh/MocA family oxidoreductase [Planctomycetota bacterium]
MAIKLGICGLGRFGQRFIELFKAHPLCSEVVLCELRSDVLNEQARENQIARTFTSYEELLRSDVDAVAIFTQRWTHAPLAIQALKAGKHVYSAVPAGVTVDELDELVKTVEETGLTYALGETSFYRPQTIWCRRRFAEDAFGSFVYGEGQYHHNMAHGFYAPFYNANGPDWQRVASVPPMWYITHSASHVLSVTFSRFAKVSCFGWQDDHFEEDGIFNEELSAFDNAFSNQTALFRTADGGMARINEFRRTAAGECRQSIIGTHAAYAEQVNPMAGTISVQQQMDGTEGDVKESAQSQAVWTDHEWEREPKHPDGSFDHESANRLLKRSRKDMTYIHRLDGVEITEENLGDLPRDYLGKRHHGVSCVHEVERLPKEFVGLPNGHCGSHQFLVQDFLEAIDTGKLPPNHVWIGARYSVGGAVAHESSKREGESLPVPDFGVPPADLECLDPLVRLKA